MSMKKKPILALSLLIVMSAMLVTPAFAVPQNNKLVINVTYSIINEEDPGYCSWHWAMDYRMVHIQAWQLPDGSYLVKVTSTGMFYVPKGAASPYYMSITQERSAFGVLKSCEIYEFKGTLNPTHFANGAPLKMKGYLGTADYGGTYYNILHGPYEDANPGKWIWIDHYFSDVDIDWPWRGHVWTYRLCGDPKAVSRYYEISDENGYVGNIVT